jgi:hypothetical protein
MTKSDKKNPSSLTSNLSRPITTCAAKNRNKWEVVAPHKDAFKSIATVKNINI